MTQLIKGVLRRLKKIAKKRQTGVTNRGKEGILLRLHQVRLIAPNRISYCIAGITSLTLLLDPLHRLLSRYSNRQYDNAIRPSTSVK